MRVHALRHPEEVDAVICDQVREVVLFKKRGGSGGVDGVKLKMKHSCAARQ